MQGGGRKVKIDVTGFQENKGHGILVAILSKHRSLMNMKKNKQDVIPELPSIRNC